MDEREYIQVRVSNKLALKWARQICEEFEWDLLILGPDEDARGGIALFSAEGETDDELLGTHFITGGPTSRVEHWPQWAQDAYHGYAVICDSDGRILLDNLKVELINSYAIIAD